ncbi:hypothetical protein P8452_03698 [Trifolium repens]|nr:hypothetical protein P8452_03698 [Trifolium repens]
MAANKFYDKQILNRAHRETKKQTTNVAESTKKKNVPETLESESELLLHLGIALQNRIGIALQNRNCSSALKP